MVWVCVYRYKSDVVIFYRWLNYIWFFERYLFNVWGGGGFGWFFVMFLCFLSLLFKFEIWEVLLLLIRFWFLFCNGCESWWCFCNFFLWIFVDFLLCFDLFLELCGGRNSLNLMLLEVLGLILEFLLLSFLFMEFGGVENCEVGLR